MSNDPIYTLAVGAAAFLREQGSGVALHYGKQRFGESAGGLICELTRFGRDTFSPPRQAGTYTENGTVYRDVANVEVGVRARFSGLDPKSGAGEHDHRGAVWDAVQETMAAIRDVSFSSAAGRINRMPVTFGEGEFIEPDGDAVRELGARYELQMTISAVVRRAVGELANAPIGIVTVKAKGLDGTEETNCGV